MRVRNTVGDSVAKDLVTLFLAFGQISMFCHLGALDNNWGCDECNLLEHTWCTGLDAQNFGRAFQQLWFGVMFMHIWLHTCASNCLLIFHFSFMATLLQSNMQLARE